MSQKTIPRIRRTAIALGVGCAIAVAAAGCGAGVADSRKKGLPDMAPAESMDTDTPWVGTPGDGSLKVVTWSSGNCPPEATAIDVADDIVTIEFMTSDNRICTANIAPTTHTFGPRTIGEHFPDKARIIFPEFNKVRTLDIIHYP